MPTHARENIILALLDALGTIATVVPGKTWATTTTPSVVRQEVNIQSEPRFPIVIVGSKDETLEGRASESTWNIYVRTLSVRLLYFVETWDTGQTLSDVLHDVELALNDPTLGNTCDDLVFVSNRTLDDNDGQIQQGIEIMIQIKYRTATNDPSTRR